MRIDVHAHYWPAAYIDALVAAGRHDLARAGRQADDFDKRLAVMDRNGVELQLLSAIGLSTDVAEPAAALDAVQVMNGVYDDVVARYPGRFGAFASVCLPHVDEAIAETDRVLGRPGFAGIALPCIAGGRPIDHPDFEPFWRNLARHDAVVYVHPAGTDSAVHPGLSEWNLHTAIGSPGQITAAPIRILYSGLPERYPSLRFVFAMCAGNLPLLWPRLERNLRRGFEMSALAAVGTSFFDWITKLPLDPKDPMSGFKKFWYDVSMQDVPAVLMLARDTYGADRLLLGSDEIFASLDEAVRFVQTSPYLDDEQKTAILDTNAEQMLGADLVHALTSSVRT